MRRSLFAVIVAVFTFVVPQTRIAEAAAPTTPDKSDVTSAGDIQSARESDAQRANRLAQENLVLRQEVAALRAEIIVLKKNPATANNSSAATTKPGVAESDHSKAATRAYTGFPEFISELPEGRGPSKGQEWNDLLQSRATQWHAENSVGRIMEVTLAYADSDGIRDGTFEMRFHGTSFDFEGINYYGMTVALLPQALADKAVKLRVGDTVKVVGRIQRVAIDKGFSSSSVGLHVDLVDATFEPVTTTK
jgi:hypothetical protein